MKIGTPKEVFEGENRVAMTPDSARQLQKLGYDCLIETGAGAKAGFSDALPEGEYVDFADGSSVTIEAGYEVELPGWGYRLLSSNSR